jgi:hypothetical protein
VKYFVKRGEQEYGPYTLADLQLYVQQGSISPQDVARSEGMAELLTVEQIVGNISVPTAANQFGMPQTGFGAVSDPIAAPTGALPNAHLNPPPALHWGWVLALSLITCFIFLIIWQFIQAAFIRRLRPGNSAIFYLLGYVLTAFGGLFIVAQYNVPGLDLLLNVASWVLIIAANFSMKHAMEDYYNSDENIGLYLSGVMTFFFAAYYFQYHFNRITKWKTTGSLPQ